MMAISIINYLQEENAVFNALNGREKKFKDFSLYVWDVRKLLGNLLNFQMLGMD